MIAWFALWKLRPTIPVLMSPNPRLPALAGLGVLNFPHLPALAGNRADGGV